MCGGLKPHLTVGASQVCQRASLLEPSIHTHLDVTVDVPVYESILIIRKLHVIKLAKTFFVRCFGPVQLFLIKTEHTMDYGVINQ